MNKSLPQYIFYHFEIQFVSYTFASTLRVEKQKGSNAIE